MYDQWNIQETVTLGAKNVTIKTYHHRKGQVVRWSSSSTVLEKKWRHLYCPL